MLLEEEQEEPSVQAKRQRKWQSAAAAHDEQLRQKQLPQYNEWVQCGKCRAWRVLPPGCPIPVAHQRWSWQAAIADSNPKEPTRVNGMRVRTFDC